MKVAERPETMPPGPSRPPKPAAVVVPHAPKWSQKLIAGLVFALERLLTASLRFEWHDQTGLFECAKAQPVIFCFNRPALDLLLATGQAAYDGGRIPQSKGFRSVG